MHTIGLISDTHGLLRPQLETFMTGCELIVHAGDIGSAQVVPALEAWAPVRAVCGNVDTQPWTRRFPRDDLFQIGGKWLYVLHIVEHLPIDPVAAGVDVVVHGHSHRAGIKTKQGVLYVNPGSAGPRRFSLPVTVARLTIDEHGIEAAIEEIAI